MKEYTNEQYVIKKLLGEESCNNEEFLTEVLELMAKKININQALYFYDIAIKRQLLAFEELDSKLRREISTMPIKIDNDVDMVTSLPYFRETLFDSGKPSHESAKKNKLNWQRMYKPKDWEKYYEINPEAKGIIERIMKK